MQKREDIGLLNLDNWTWMKQNSLFIGLIMNYLLFNLLVIAQIFISK